MTETVLLSIQDHIATISFNRPEVMNAFNHQMADDLCRVTARVREDTNVRAVILNGMGKLFMAGGDIRMFHSMLNDMPKGVAEMITSLHTAITDLMTMPKPVLASVHGSVAGAGVSLMLACDLVIADQQTKFTLAYSAIGLSPDGGATYNLPRLVGPKKAMEWLLLSEMFDADTAKTHGLINWTVPADELSKQTLSIAKRLAYGPTFAFAGIKRLVQGTWQHDLATQLQQESKSFEACTTTKDFKNGVMSFVEKRAPEFIGK